jgi:predicted nuclease of predicted toxin-antitoxin system
MPHDMEWEIWLDCHLSPILAKWINEETKLTAKSSFILGLHGLRDEEIYLKARKQGNVIIISKDTDIRQLIMKYGSPPKLIELVSGNAKSKVLWQYIEPKIEQIVRRLIKEDINILVLNIGS